MKGIFKKIVITIAVVIVLVIGGSYAYVGFVANKTIVNDFRAYPMPVPPLMPQELAKLGNKKANGLLTASELNQYNALQQQRVKIWPNQPTLGELLIPVKTNRKQFLIEELRKRNISEIEIKRYLESVKEQFPKIIKDESEFIWVIEVEENNG